LFYFIEKKDFCKGNQREFSDNKKVCMEILVRWKNFKYTDVIRMKMDGHESDEKEKKIYILDYSRILSCEYIRTEWMWKRKGGINV
jgi:hypothetical protein